MPALEALEAEISLASRALNTCHVAGCQEAILTSRNWAVYEGLVVFWLPEPQPECKELLPESTSSCCILNLLHGYAVLAARNRTRHRIICHMSLTDLCFQVSEEAVPTEVVRTGKLRTFVGCMIFKTNGALEWRW